MASQSRSTRREPRGCYRTRICESWLIWAPEQKKLNIGSATSVTNMLRSMEIIGHRLDVQYGTTSAQNNSKRNYGMIPILRPIVKKMSYFPRQCKAPNLQSIHQESCCCQHRPVTTPTRTSRLILPEVCLGAVIQNSSQKVSLGSPNGSCAVSTDSPHK